MSELIWINGEIQPLADARIGVEDRGFQFADGVYEVIRLYKRKPFALDLHLQRLEKSAAGIQLSLPIGAPALTAEIGKFLAQAAVPDGMIYLQLTRGCAPRNHAFSQTQATLLFYVRALPPVADAATSDGLKLVTVPDERWKRCWIKSIGLLPNVLAKNQALAAGADEAVFVENDLVTECSASNIFAVIGGRLVTHPVGGKVLPGITRAVLLELARKLQVSVDERVQRRGSPPRRRAIHHQHHARNFMGRPMEWPLRRRWPLRSHHSEVSPCGLREKVQRETA